LDIFGHEYEFGKWELENKIRTNNKLPLPPFVMSLVWTRRLSTLNHALKEVLRDSAQSVAIVTSHMPLEKRVGPHSKFHGATLSSFSSIALDPHPLVAFSLRMPSRMATSLQNVDCSKPSHMVINILSACQASTAVRFANARLHPYPFAETRYSLTEDGLPILYDSLGAISCKLVSLSKPLHDLDALEVGGGKQRGKEWTGPGVASELFIARAVRVEKVLTDDVNNPLRTSPLLYHRQGYGTVRPLDP
jgi:flavin reductase (DIM6/NTAB) family NADH-FMN oxidoreductase RutF